MYIYIINDYKYDDNTSFKQQFFITMLQISYLIIILLLVLF